MGIVFVEGTVIGPNGKEAKLEFLVDSGATYTLLPLKLWRAIGLRPNDSVRCRLADGTPVERKVSECEIVLGRRKRHTPVMLGKEGDEALLGTVTLAEFSLTLNPFTRKLQPMRVRLSRWTRSMQIPAADEGETESDGKPQFPAPCWPRPCYDPPSGEAFKN